ncbi:MAG TPA: copper oxidase [Thermoanaerobaculia bacterium]|jgi:hypothetical protein
MFKKTGLALGLLVLALFLSNAALAQQASTCPGTRTIVVNMVAIDQPFLLNRLGAAMPEGMVFALQRDVVPKTAGTTLAAGNAMLRPGKRARPIVLRANVGDCLQINFRNLLGTTPSPVPPQPATRYASVHVAGMELVNTIKDAGTFVGANGNGTVPPDGRATYLIRATAEGVFLLNSEGAAFGGFNQPNDGAQVTAGLFGAVTVAPARSEWYRSQVTHFDLEHAIDTTKGNGGFSPIGQPFLNYRALFPAGTPNAGDPVLAMLKPNSTNANLPELIYTDLTAVITGPNAGRWPDGTGDPNLKPVNIEPNRRDPYREFVITYHELMDVAQAFPVFSANFSPNGQPATPEQKALATTLGAAGDAFAINMGTGGIGSEILANRFGLGPMNSCVDCRFEEFFLSSWTVGDPAVLVDVPANLPCQGSTPGTNKPEVTVKSTQSHPCSPGVAGNAPTGIQPMRKATQALYPDDPSNVYHSYINDRVKFRVLHTGTGVSHVHHLHAHQWVHSPNSDGSTYLDSQLINPGSAYTLEITFNGGGNRNKVVGDSIFHCHFYPHFAAGMWAHWRTHDVYEVGSPFNTTRFPSQLGKYGSRALPDGEIAQGTPIPALIPMPVLAMPPMPGEVKLVAVMDPNGSGNPLGWRPDVPAADIAANRNPGYPFFIPGVAGTRAPHPPMDFATENDPNGVAQIYDGGLPRHILVNGRITNEQHTPVNFSKDYDQVNAYQLPEDGTAIEKVAMQYHSVCFHDTFTPLGAPARFRTNGLPPTHGAPYADPGLDPYADGKPDGAGNECVPIKKSHLYKGAVIQKDLVLNKKGWHYPQARFLTLWQDVLPTWFDKVPPQPFFIRANDDSVVNYWHTNLVPDYYELDDYQVRTPTDIIGQHIHLVKFDVTSSDGAANGYNYEDGTFSPQEVQELVKHINDCGGLATSPDTISKCGTAANRQKLTLKPPPAEICPDPNADPCNAWWGAQTTVQRWYADPLSMTPDNDPSNPAPRTMRTVFTHDHFGPSTHQQTGLYAAFLVEPAGSAWYQSETGVKLNTRTDGGPTTWNAIIETPFLNPDGTPTNRPNPANTYREFALAVADFQLAYKATSKPNVSPDPNVGWSDPGNVIEAPFGNSKVQPQIVSSGPSPGTTSFNYRNEPLPFRVATGSSTDPKVTDMSYVFNSLTNRNDPQVNVQPTLGALIDPSRQPVNDPAAKPQQQPFRWPYAPLTAEMQPGDPFTPLLRAYEGDNVQIRIVAGAHMLPHAFTFGGAKWLFEPSFPDSGYRSSQSFGISEHFEFLFQAPRASPSATPQTNNFTDYLYQPDASNQKHGIIDGTWGIFRAYKSTSQYQANLRPLNINPVVNPLPPANDPAGYSCPPGAPRRTYSVQSRTPATLTFNSRGAGPAGRFPTGSSTGTTPETRFGTQILNWNPLIYTLADNTQASEPLILRANAGDCISVTVQNAFNPTSPTFTNTSTTVPWNTSQLIPPSKNVGLTPSLLSYDAMASTGINVGFNPDQVVAPGGSKTYYWYAGQTSIAQNGTITGTPMELGSVNLTPSDVLGHDSHGLIGGLIVEPPGSIWCLDTYDPQANMPQYAAATVYASGTCQSPGRLLYREFVLVTQDSLQNVEWYGGKWSLGGTTFTAPGGQSLVGVNYRTEPMSYRFADLTSNFYLRPDIWTGYANGLVLSEPQTPIFTAAGGTPTRFRLLHPAGSGNQQVLAIHGHVWQELPYTNGSTAIGNNPLSQWLGARDNYGTNMAYEAVIASAGGQVPVFGDYLWRTTPANYAQQGLWGLFRVSRGGSDAVRIASAQFTSGGALSIYGSTSVFVDKNANPRNGNRASTVDLYLGSNGNRGNKIGTANVGLNGLWSLATNTTAVTGNNFQITAVSPNGGTGIAPVAVVAVPATPLVVTAPQPTAETGESARFLALPRENAGERQPVQQPDAEDDLPATLNAPPPPNGAVNNNARPPQPE